MCCMFTVQIQIGNNILHTNFAEMILLILLLFVTNFVNVTLRVQKAHSSRTDQFTLLPDLS